MKCVATIYRDDGEKICTITAKTNLDNEIKNENRVEFKECTLDVIEFVRIWEVYRNISRCI